MDYTSIPYLGIAGTFIIILGFFNKAGKKLDLFNFFPIEDSDKIIIKLLLVSVVIFDFLSKQPLVCSEWIPKLPNLLLIVALVFLLCVGGGRFYEKRKFKKKK